MKRVALHGCFWIAYLVQDTWLAYLWDGPLLAHLGNFERIRLAFTLCASLVLPKILFAYFILYFVLQRVYAPVAQKIVTVALLLLALAALLLTVRSIEMYFVYPVLYHGLIKHPRFWSPFSFLFAFIDIGYISGIAIAIKLIRTQFAFKEKQKSLIREKLEAELKFLRNQTNPHFLFNTLNNIYGLSLRKANETPQVVMKLSKLLRFMIYETKSAFIKLGDEIKMLENFIELERIRYTKKVCIDFTKEVDDENQPIIPLLLLPFVENAFKHGVSENRFACFISIHAELRKGVLRFCVENSKEGGKPEAIVESVGLSNVKRQLELMYRDYELDIENGAETFKVYLKLNLKDHASL